MGVFKGETGIRNYFQDVVRNTASKLKFGWWLERFNDGFIQEGQRNGPVCYNEEGNLNQASQYQDTFVNFYGNSTGTHGYHFGGCE